MYFYPRPPRGGRQALLPNEVDILIFLSTPSARRATGGLAFAAINDKISIHALREEGDIQFFFDRTKAAFISIHALREEGDLHPRCNPGGWSAISIHALREEGDANVAKQRVDLFISIHALREEGDGLLLSSIRKPRNFYPRPPRGGRQQKQRQNLYFQTNCTTFCTNLEEP